MQRLFLQTIATIVTHPGVYVILIMAYMNFMKFWTDVGI